MTKFCYQEFESWLLNNFGTKVSRNEKGEMSNAEVHLMFQVWKAAWEEGRTAFAVQLPQYPVLGSDAEWYKGYAGGWSDCITALKNICKQERIRFEVKS